MLPLLLAASCAAGLASASLPTAQTQATQLADMVDVAVDTVTKLDTAAGHDFATYLPALITVESRWLVTAESSVGARGLMQLTPPAVLDAISYCNIDRVPHKLDLFDPAVNLRLGVCYLHLLYTRYRDHPAKWLLVLAAYNGGTRQADRLARGARLVPETANYIAQVQYQAATCGAPVQLGRSLGDWTDE